jgi:ABC-type multidrug transport system fused ATPase/permease subunit
LTSSQSKSVNWKAAVFWGLIIGAVCFLIYQYREPILAWIAKPTFDFSILQNLTLDKIIAFFQQYLSLIVTGAAAFTFIYGFYQKHQANKAAIERLNSEQNAQIEVNKAYGLADQYKTQAETYKSQVEQLDKNDLGESLKEAQDQVTQKQQEINSLKSQLEALNNIVLLKDTKVIEKTVVK